MCIVWGDPLENVEIMPRLCRFQFCFQDNWKMAVANREMVQLRHSFFPITQLLILPWIFSLFYVPNSRYVLEIWSASVCIFWWSCFVSCTCTHAYMHTCLHAHMPTCTHAYMHTCLHAHMPTCTHAYMHTCLHAHMPTCTHAYMHTCLHAHMPTCTHAYMHTCLHAHMPTCTHAYMHTYSH